MIEVRSLSLVAGQFRLENVSFAVDTGSYAVLMGPSGIGKTTILEAICGLRRIQSGQILLGGKSVEQMTPGERGVGYVPQDLGLFPTMTVREHLEFPLRIRSWAKSVISERVEEMAGLLHIEPLLSRGVRHLSGGEAQRVALGRALSFRPAVLLLDEPLSALDEQTRMRLQGLLTEIKSNLGTTTLHVTHNRDEAEHLADVRLNLQNGQIVEDSG